MTEKNVQEQSNFKAITTQEELNYIIGDRIKREKATTKKELDELRKENASLKEIIDKNNLDFEKLNNDLKDRDNVLNSYKIKDLKTSIALKNGIPYELASRLNGDDEKTINDDALNFIKLLSPKQIQPSKDYEGNKKANPYKDLLDGLNLN